MAQNTPPSKLPVIVMGLGAMTAGVLMMVGTIEAPIDALPYALFGSGLGVMIAGFAKPAKKRA